MEYTDEEDEYKVKQKMTHSDQLLDALDPTKLIDIDFYKSYGLWDDEMSEKYDVVIKKWEHIKRITENDTID